MNLGDRIKAELVKRAIVAFLNWLAGWFRAKAAEPDPHTSDLSPADRAESFTKAIPPKPKPARHKVRPKPWDSW